MLNLKFRFGDVDLLDDVKENVEYGGQAKHSIMKFFVYPGTIFRRKWRTLIVLMFHIFWAYNNSNMSLGNFGSGGVLSGELDIMGEQTRKGGRQNTTGFQVLSRESTMGENDITIGIAGIFGGRHPP